MHNGNKKSPLNNAHHPKTLGCLMQLSNSLKVNQSKKFKLSLMFKAMGDGAGIQNRINHNKAECNKIKIKHYVANGKSPNT